MDSTNETNIQRARLIKKGVLERKRKKKERVQLEDNTEQFLENLE